MISTNYPSKNLRVEPGEIRFTNAIPGTLYVMTFSVRNLSKSAQRIRISAPKIGVFALNYIPLGPIASGLDLRAEIECQIPTSSQEFVYADSITVSMGDDKIDIPIYALKPFANIDFPKELSFGNIILKQSAIKDIVFRNKSDQPGVMKLSIGKGSRIRLSTNKLEFSATSSGDGRHVQTLKVALEGKELGPVREIIVCSLEGSMEEYRIDVSAHIIDQSLTLITVLILDRLFNKYYSLSK